MLFLIVFLSIISPIQLDHTPKCDDQFSNFPPKGYTLVYKVSSLHAIDATLGSTLTKQLILIDTGIYRERVLVPKTKKNLVMQASSSNGAFESFSVALFGGKLQAVALRVVGEKAAFYGCGFYGNQDTFLDQEERHYFIDCFIEVIYGLQSYVI
ncbi:hypothetical protein CARUB_v10025222mg [Capsella rubella]|uniref:pectinesterase n=1 Tax=Capsella rubella TaxID=81985 RepID=R0HU94_9BRAS|nr:hypothetical protein CARUB_v10025222mg [Capsella rubella]